MTGVRHRRGGLGKAFGAVERQPFRAGHDDGLNRDIVPQGQQPDPGVCRSSARVTLRVPSGNIPTAMPRSSAACARLIALAVGLAAIDRESPGHRTGSA